MSRSCLFSIMTYDLLLPNETLWRPTWRPIGRPPPPSHPYHSRPYATTHRGAQDSQPSSYTGQSSRLYDDKTGAYSSRLYRLRPWIQCVWQWSFPNHTPIPTSTRTATLWQAMLADTNKTCLCDGRMQCNCSHFFFFNYLKKKTDQSID